MLAGKLHDLAPPDPPLCLSAMKTLRLLIVLTAATLTAPIAAAQNPLAGVAQSEAQVRSLPIHQRPNRFGHFYGNTVRRRHYGTLVVNTRHTDRPVARYFYMAR